MQVGGCGEGQEDGVRKGVPATCQCRMGGEGAVVSGMHREGGVCIMSTLRQQQAPRGEADE
jgi:hypothetical protein